MAQNPGMELDLLLKDIHLPGAVGVWPLAPGWWLLLGLLGLLIVVTFFGFRFWKGRRMRRLALARLAELTNLPENELAAALSRLLRQAAIGHFPANIAGLSGLSWLEFLDRPFADCPFSRGAGRCLLDAPYREEAQIDSAALISLCRRWLQKLPPQTLGQRWGQ